MPELIKASLKLIHCEPLTTCANPVTYATLVSSPDFGGCGLRTRLMSCFTHINVHCVPVVVDTLAYRGHVAATIFEYEFMFPRIFGEKNNSSSDVILDPLSLSLCEGAAPEITQAVLRKNKAPSRTANETQRQDYSLSTISNANGERILYFAMHHLEVSNCWNRIYTSNLKQSLPPSLQHSIQLAQEKVLLLCSFPSQSRSLDLLYIRVFFNMPSLFDITGNHYLPRRMCLWYEILSQACTVMP